MSTSDTEAIAALIANDERPLEEAVARRCASSKAPTRWSRSRRAGSSPSATRTGSARSSSGALGDDWVVASETCALDLVGAKHERGRPGRARLVDATGCTRRTPGAPSGGALCIFEYVYLARPDSDLDGVEVYGARVRMGEQLAREAPVDADIVMPIPDSGTPAAIGFARASGIPFGEGLIKNRYVGRTFIQPEQGMREQGIRMKFNPLTEIAGKRVVIVDDTIVRGSTTRQIVDAFDAGAREVHIRVSSPPVVSPCFYGIDFADTDAARRRRPQPRRGARAARRDLAGAPLARRHAGGDAAPRVGDLPRLLHAALPDRDAARRPAREAPVRGAGARQHRPGSRA